MPTVDELVKTVNRRFKVSWDNFRRAENAALEARRREAELASAYATARTVRPDLLPRAMQDRSR